MKKLMVLLLSFTLLQGVYSAVCRGVEQEIVELKKTVQDLTALVQDLLNSRDNNPTESQLNVTVEERLTLLELQVSDLDNDLEAVEDEVIILSSGDLNQDQRILELEIDSDGFEDSIESLIGTDISVIQELTSVTQELTSVTQELTSVTQELTSVNENILDLQDRVQAQEVSGAIAFQAEIGEYEAIPEESVVLFSIVDLNFGNGFDILTGEFRVPSGGSGLYYFRFGYLSNFQVYCNFRIRKNGVRICRAYTNINTSGVNDLENSSCAAVVNLVEGDIVDVYYASGTNDTPVISGTGRDNTFTGFRIAPQ